MLSYSDKAVSKWERGESIPDISVLKSIADLFGVSLDFLVSEKRAEEIRSKINTGELNKISFTNHAFITSMSVVLVWLIATFTFFVLNTAGIQTAWLVFIISVPLSFLVWLVLNSVWFNPRLNYLIISLFLWSLLSCIFLFLLVSGFKLPLIFIIGIPSQLIILLWSRIKSENNVK